MLECKYIYVMNSTYIFVAYVLLGYYVKCYHN